MLCWLRETFIVWPCVTGGMIWQAKTGVLRGEHVIAAHCLSRWVSAVLLEATPSLWQGVSFQQFHIHVIFCLKEMGVTFACLQIRFRYWHSVCLLYVTYPNLRGAASSGSTASRHLHFVLSFCNRTHQGKQCNARWSVMLCVHWDANSTSTEIMRQNRDNILLLKYVYVCSVLSVQ
jgi:hypothetical protein